jgi:uncharacterized protein YjbI with pentapeptide repeats
MEITIKNTDGNIIFKYDCEDNTIKKTVEEAVRQKVDLFYVDFYGADLRFANLKGAHLYYANFYGADLRFANLKEANLSEANLNYAYVCNADLRFANLKGAHLYYADLFKANLYGADLSNTDFSYAKFNGTDLSCTNLSGANLRCADFSYADLSNSVFHNTLINQAYFITAKNIPPLPMNLPSGEFIGWKAFPNDLIAKLKILKDSKRSQATTNKCRCDKALVLEFQNINGSKADLVEYTNTKFIKCTYKVGEVVYADSWDNNRWNECSHGIHFFMDRETAVDYYCI